ncbi:anti-sigma factor [Micromonospora sp. R77]|uniref:anti-sigma factor n=1 Tax=Micromonospora sp. R77 TaxID=2925836 RepID=UPI001F61368D|nr:anti-sigma factor [Micromonospora sp. R77]MCI4062434.1 anti-sigma factor [Micromonospora sp. R77]
MTDIHALAGAYVLDAVDDVERAAFARHLAGCESCTLEVAELREAAARLAEPTWSVPPPRLRDEVLAAVRRTCRSGRAGRDAGTGPLAAHRRGGRRRHPGRRPGTATWLVQEQRVRDEHAATVAARAETERIRAVLAAPDAVVRSTFVPSGGRVTVVSSTGRAEGVVALAGLATPGSGRAYQLWLISDGTAASAGVLPAGRNAATVLIGGVRGGAVVGVTEEPAGGSGQPTMDPLVAITLT